MRKAIFTLLFLFFTGWLFANNITVANTSLSGQNTTAHFTLINFDVAWENSWRTSTNESNYDGAWIFVKYRKNGTTDWRHCTINATGHTNAAGSAFSVPTDGKGAFIYRSADGIGNVNFMGNKLQWNYGADGVLDNETVEIRVFALEMVYIPQGSFQLGSGGSEANAFTDGSSTSPYMVSSNSAINLGTTAGTLNPNGQGSAAGTIPVAFPKGFAAFWIMKYECSQQQYVDFLNHLDLSRATVNNVGASVTGTHPNLTTAFPERAAYQLGFRRTAALADWSGLRPMTELEFEKACRGYNTPAVPNEFVWGNTTLNPLTSVTDQGTSTEAVASPTNANANIASSINVPTRTGLFARASSDRTLSGGTYYGVMNMGDNVQEAVISIVNPSGRADDASVHGDGYLAASGETDQALWTSYLSFGTKGGGWNTGTSDARTSYRAAVGTFSSYPSDLNATSFGIRLARTAQ